MAARKNKKPNTGDTQPKALLLPISNPLQAYEPEQRAQLAAVANQNSRRKALPRGWQQMLVAIIAAGPYTDSMLAAALRLSLRTFQRLKTENLEVAEVIARADAHLQARVLSPIMQRALSGDANCAMWVAARMWPEQFAERPKVAITNNTQINNAPAIPAPLASVEDYQRLLAAARAPNALPAPAVEGEVVPT